MLRYRRRKFKANTKRQKLLRTEIEQLAGYVPSTVSQKLRFYAQHFVNKCIARNLVRLRNCFSGTSFSRPLFWLRRAENEPTSSTILNASCSNETIVQNLPSGDQEIKAENSPSSSDIINNNNTIVQSSNITFKVPIIIQNCEIDKPLEILFQTTNISSQVPIPTVIEISSTASICNVTNQINYEFINEICKIAPSAKSIVSHLWEPTILKFLRKIKITYRGYFWHTLIASIKKMTDEEIFLFYKIAMRYETVASKLRIFENPEIESEEIRQDLLCNFFDINFNGFDTVYEIISAWYCVLPIIYEICYFTGKYIPILDSIINDPGKLYDILLKLQEDDRSCSDDSSSTLNTQTGSPTIV